MIQFVRQIVSLSVNQIMCPLVNKIMIPIWARLDLLESAGATLQSSQSAQIVSVPAKSTSAKKGRFLSELSGVRLIVQSALSAVRKELNSFSEVFSDYRTSRRTISRAVDAHIFLTTIHRQILQTVPVFLR